MVKRYCWFNMPDGKFSDSWDEEIQEGLSEEIIKFANQKGFKLIEYTCINDPDFEFVDDMKLR